MSKQVSTKTRKAVFERARFCCEYCFSRESYSNDSFEVEHILPRVKGGTSALDNLALACGGCNRLKANKTNAIDPETKRKASLFNPRKQKWNEHFSWTNDYTKIVGLTSTGRATINALKLNREQLVNLRRVLHYFGEHPPEQND